MAVRQTGSLPRRADWWLAFSAFLLGSLEMVGDETSYAFPLVQFVLVVGVSAAIPWRRQQVLVPVAVVLGLQAAIDIGIRVSGRVDSGVPGAQQLAGLLLVYSLCRWAPPRQLFTGFAVVIVAATISGVALANPSVSESIMPWLLVGLAALVMRYRSVLNMNRVEQAKLTERNVLARELHDSVAHHVSAIAVQAQAAQFVASSDPMAAAAAMADVEQTANRAIDEMRRMVGVLRSSDDIARTVPSASLADLADSTLSPRVRVNGETDLTGMSPSVAVAIYRVAQEAITNARKHARGVTCIDITCAVTPEVVVLQVINDGALESVGAHDGYGLIGMEERVLALGGELVAGPLPDGGWSVTARIPGPGDPDAGRSR